MPLVGDTVTRGKRILWITSPKIQVDRCGYNAQLVSNSERELRGAHDSAHGKVEKSSVSARPRTRHPESHRATVQLILGMHVHIRQIVGPYHHEMPERTQIPLQRPR